MPSGRAPAYITNVRERSIDKNAKIDKRDSLYKLPNSAIYAKVLSYKIFKSKCQWSNECPLKSLLTQSST